MTDSTDAAWPQEFKTTSIPDAVIRLGAVEREREGVEFATDWLTEHGYESAARALTLEWWGVGYDGDEPPNDSAMPGATAAPDREALARALRAADDPYLGYERRYPEVPDAEADAINSDAESLSWRYYLPMADALLASGLFVPADTIRAEAWNEGVLWALEACGYDEDWLDVMNFDHEPNRETANPYRQRPTE